MRSCSACARACSDWRRAWSADFVAASACADAAGAGLDELTADLKVYPQKLVNVRVREKKGLTELPAVANEIRRVEEEFAGSGRVLVRFSGTEPLARVMVEGQDADQVESFSASIAEAIRREMGA
jgi:phosphoglucosamine mutase